MPLASLCTLGALVGLIAGDAAPHAPSNSTGLQDPRAPSAGRVVDALGAPVANAEVTLLHRPLAGQEDPSAEDRIRTTSDAQGMFRVELRQDADYSVWARWDEGATAIAEGVVGGDFVELEGDPHAASRALSIHGLEAWAHRGPMRIRACVGSAHLDYVDVPFVDGAWVLPPLPPMANRTIEIFDQAGILIWAIRTNSNLNVPEPTPIELRACDDQGNGLAGATVQYHILNYWRTESPYVPMRDRFLCLWPVVGVTDQDGTLSVEVAIEPAWQQAHFLARLPGHRPAVSGHAHFGPYRNGKEAKDAGELVVMTLTPLNPSAEALRVFGSPVRSGEWSAYWRVHARSADGGGVGTPWVHEPRAVDEAGIDLSRVPEGTSLERIQVPVPERARAAILERFGVACPRTWTFGTSIASQLLDGGTLPGVDALRALQILEPDGRPADGAVLVSSDASAPKSRESTWRRANRSGQALVLVDRLEMRTLVVGREGWAAIRIPDDAPDRIPVSLQPFEVIEVAVRAEDGAPVPHALVRASIKTMPDGSDIHLWECHAFHHLTEIRAGADGRARVRLPRVEATWNLEARRDRRSKWQGGELVKASAEPFAGSQVLEIQNP